MLRTASLACRNQTYSHMTELDLSSATLVHAADRLPLASPAHSVRAQNHRLLALVARRLKTLSMHFDWSSGPKASPAAEYPAKSGDSIRGHCCVIHVAAILIGLPAPPVIHSATGKLSQYRWLIPLSTCQTAYVTNPQTL